MRRKAPPLHRQQRLVGLAALDPPYENYENHEKSWWGSFLDPPY